jgi:hypothetical protein
MPLDAPAYNNTQDILSDVTAMHHALAVLSQSTARGGPQQAELVSQIAERLASCQDAYRASLTQDYESLVREYDNYVQKCEDGVISLSPQEYAQTANAFIEEVGGMRRQLDDEGISWADIETKVGVEVEIKSVGNGEEAEEEDDDDDDHRDAGGGVDGEGNRDNAALGGDYGEDVDDEDEEEKDEDDEDANVFRGLRESMAKEFAVDEAKMPEFEADLTEAFEFACRCCPASVSEDEQRIFLKSFFDRFESPARSMPQLKDILIQCVIDKLREGPGADDAGAGTVGGDDGRGGGGSNDDDHDDDGRDDGDNDEDYEDSEASDRADRPSRLDIPTAAISVSADGYPTISPVRRMLKARETEALDFAEELSEPTLHPAVSPRRRPASTLVDAAMDHIEEAQDSGDEDDDVESLKSERDDDDGDDGDDNDGDKDGGDEDDGEENDNADESTPVYRTNGAAPTTDAVRVSNMLQRVLGLMQRGRPAFDFLSLLFDRLEKLPVEDPDLHKPLLLFFDELEAASSEGGGSGDGGGDIDDNDNDDDGVPNDDNEEEEEEEKEDELPPVIAPKIMTHLPDEGAFDYAEKAEPVLQSTDPVYVRDVVAGLRGDRWDEDEDDRTHDDHRYRSGHPPSGNDNKTNTSKTYSSNSHHKQKNNKNGNHSDNNNDDDEDSMHPPNPVIADADYGEDLNDDSEVDTDNSDNARRSVYVSPRAGQRNVPLLPPAQTARLTAPPSVEDDDDGSAEDDDEDANNNQNNSKGLPRQPYHRSPQPPRHEQPQRLVPRHARPTQQSPPPNSTSQALVPREPTSSSSVDDVERDFLRKSLAATQEANIRMQNHLMEQSKAFKQEMSQQMGQLASTLGEKLDDLANKLASSPPPAAAAGFATPGSVGPTASLLSTPQQASPQQYQHQQHQHQEHQQQHHPYYSLQPRLQAEAAQAAAHNSPGSHQLDHEVESLRAQIAGTAKLIEARRINNQEIARGGGGYLRSSSPPAAPLVSPRQPSAILPPALTAAHAAARAAGGPPVRASAVATVLTAAGQIKTYPVNVDMGGDSLDVPVPKNCKLINLTVELPEQMAPAQDVTYQVAPIHDSSGSSSYGVAANNGRLRLQFDGRKGGGWNASPPKVFAVDGVD